MDHGEAQDAARFLGQFAESAQRLADHDIVLLSLRTDWAAFGSWVLEAQQTGRHGAVVRATWDGRDGGLEVLPPAISAPTSQRFDSSSEALQHVEALLIASLAP